MNKELFIGLIIGIIIGAISGIIVFDNNYNSDKSNSVFQSTDMQPSRFFSRSLYPLGINPNAGGQIGEMCIGYENKYRLDTYQVSMTGSMYPTIPDAAIILKIEPVKENIKVGDIISFKCNNKEIIHRVIKINQTGYLTKGDNNAHDDLCAFGCFSTFENITSQVVGVLY